jgi:hypothetical protein
MRVINGQCGASIVRRVGLETTLRHQDQERNFLIRTYQS